MMIFPTIEVMNRRCVSLRRGRTEEPMVWHVDPVEKACEFVAAGASWMHLTDLDAVEGKGGSRDLILGIIRQVGIPVQLAGGFRSLERIEEWIDLGAGRIVVGTLAVLNPDLVKKAAKLHPDQIVVAVDVWQGSVMTHGWKTPSAIAPEDFVRAFDRVPLAAMILTDIDANIEFKESTLAIITALAGIAYCPCIASGVVRTCDDVARLKYLPNVAGVLIGTALFNKTVDLEEALATAQPTAEPRAEFI